MSAVADPVEDLEGKNSKQAPVSMQYRLAEHGGSGTPDHQVTVQFCGKACRYRHDAGKPELFGCQSQIDLSTRAKLQFPTEYRLRAARGIDRERVDGVPAACDVGLHQRRV